MKSLITLAIAGLILSLSYQAGKFSQRHADSDKVGRLEQDLKELKIDTQYNETAAYSDCQRMMQVNLRIERTNGCYMVLERLCNAKTKDPRKCMEQMLPNCRNLDGSDED